MTGGYDAADAADKMRSGDVDANIDGVLSDSPAVARMVVAGERAGLDEDGPLMSMLGRSTRTQTLQKARADGHVPTLNAATGLSESSVEATGYGLLVDALKPAAQQILIKGPKGSGKSTKAIDLARRLWQEFDGELSILTNIEGPDEHPDVEYADTVSEMLAWVRDTDGEKLVIGDEWSSTVNAHAHGGGQVRAIFTRFINALRKGKGGSTRLIAIGHTHDTDLAAILRTQSDVVIQADGKVKDGLIDRATVYEGWEDYTREETWFKVRGLQDVPQSSPWSFSTNYFATFDLDLDDPENQIQKGKLVENWEEYQEADDPGSSGEERRVCRGERTDGEPCRQTTDHPSGYCMPHRDQWVEDDGSDDEDGDEVVNDDDNGSDGGDDVEDDIGARDNIEEFLETHGEDGLRELFRRKYREETGGEAPDPNEVDQVVEEVASALNAVVNDDSDEVTQKDIDRLAGGFLDTHDGLSVEEARERAHELVNNTKNT